MLEAAARDVQALPAVDGDGARAQYQREEGLAYRVRVVRECALALHGVDEAAASLRPHLHAQVEEAHRPRHAIEWRDAERPLEIEQARLDAQGVARAFVGIRSHG